MAWLNPIDWLIDMGQRLWGWAGIVLIICFIAWLIWRNNDMKERTGKGMFDWFDDQDWF